jgi:hypothetical protein
MIKNLACTLGFAMIGLMLSLLNWRWGTARCNEACPEGVGGAIIAYCALLPLGFASVAMLALKLGARPRTLVMTGLALCLASLAFSWVIIP